MKKTLLGLLYFALTLGILAAVLKVANWLPSALQEGLTRKYDSVEQLKAKLHVRDVYVPSYFPQSYGWPPSTIIAQSRPFTAIVMEFRNAQTGDIALVISQTAGKGFLPDKKIAIAQIKEKVDLPLKGRAAVLEVGKCNNDVTCSRISWDEGSYKIKVEMKSAPFDLLKVADSMLR
ncbi:MAG TPA: hypothetical protein VN328_07365 [Thermodesulfovibrionales bacterium]|nr:hypothetical protein [Thermodesulfovibrionales bacterium]